MKWLCVVANDKVDLEGDCFSCDCLLSLAKVEEVPFSVEFEREIGVARDFRVTENAELVCSAFSEEIDVAGLYPVVGFQYIPGPDGEYTDLRLKEISLTARPVTRDTSIERVE